MSRYVLTETAQRDLTHIRDYDLEQADYRIARQMLVEFVEASDSSLQLLVPATGVKTWPHRARCATLPEDGLRRPCRKPNCLGRLLTVLAPSGSVPVCKWYRLF